MEQAYSSELFIKKTENADNWKKIQGEIIGKHQNSMVPIKVCQKCLYILDGNTRYRAIKELRDSGEIKWTHIKVDYIPVSAGVCLKCCNI